VYRAISGEDGAGDLYPIAQVQEAEIVHFYVLGVQSYQVVPG